MKAITILGLIFLILILAFILPNQIAKYKLSKSKETVTVSVQQLPNCSSGYRQKFIHISFQDKKYILRTKCKYVKSLRTGQYLIMLHKPGTDIFLFQDENATSELGMTIAMALFITWSVGVLICKQKKKSRLHTTKII